MVGKEDSPSLDTILQVKELKAGFDIDGKVYHAVDNVSFDVKKNKFLVSWENQAVERVSCLCPLCSYYRRKQEKSLVVKLFLKVRILRITPLIK